jgi:hypothetical protein
MESKNILLICPTEEWTSRERATLRDALLAIKNKHVPYIYCLKDSFLDIFAKQCNINCIYHEGKLQIQFYNWYKLYKMYDRLRQYDLNLVHCYEADFLPAISMLIKRNPLLPLIVTINSELEHFYRDLWMRPLTSRIDMVLLSSSELRSNIWRHLGVHPRRMDNMGLGPIESLTIDLESNQNNIEKITKEKFLKSRNITEDCELVGTVIPPHWQDNSKILPVLHSLQIINQKAKNGKKYKLLLLMQKEWKTSLIYKELNDLIVELSIENDVFLCTANLIHENENSYSIVEYQSILDLWIGLESSEILEDYTLSATFNEIPVIIPRTASNIVLVHDYLQVGESYKRGDSRELRNKWELVMKSYSSYKKGIKKAIAELTAFYDHSIYEERLMKLYERTIEKRERVFYRGN